MNKAPAFQLYVRDIISSPTIRTMSGEAVKAYFYLLCFAWLSEPRATLPDEDKSLARMASLSLDEWTSMKDEVMQNFELVEGRWVNHRLLKVSKNSFMMSDRNSRNGSHGGNPNFHKGQPNPYNRKDNPPDNRKDKPRKAEDKKALKAED